MGEAMCPCHMSKREKWTGKREVNGELCFVHIEWEVLEGPNRTDAQETMKNHEKDLSWGSYYQATL